MSKIDLSGKKFFIAPLNWGLGHATRSMPIIDKLISLNAEIVLGGDGRSFELLKQEYPNLTAIELPSYDVKYTGNAAMVAITLLRTPKYLLAIKKEHDELQKIVKSYNINFVISDNRYGLFSNAVPTIFICHQIALIPPKLLSFGSPIAYRLHRSFLDRFDHIWIPDFSDERNLTGKLTLKYPLTDKMAFIGTLSRFSKNPNNKKIEKFGAIDIVCVLSGPEPQRTLLESTILEEVKSIDRKVLIVQGKTEKYELNQYDNITVISYLKANELQLVMRQASVIVARSGYSTVMDLSVLGKKAILIPTPGQTEQEYLANNLSKEGKVVMRYQSKLNLVEALEEVKNIAGFDSINNTDKLLEYELNRIFKD